MKNSSQRRQDKVVWAELELEIEPQRAFYCELDSRLEMGFRVKLPGLTKWWLQRLTRNEQKKVRLKDFWVKLLKLLPNLNFCGTNENSRMSWFRGGLKRWLFCSLGKEEMRGWVDVKAQYTYLSDFEPIASQFSLTFFTFWAFKEWREIGLIAFFYLCMSLKGASNMIFSKSNFLWVDFSYFLRVCFIGCMFYFFSVMRKCIEMIFEMEVQAEWGYLCKELARRPSREKWGILESTASNQGVAPQTVSYWILIPNC